MSACSQVIIFSKKTTGLTPTVFVVFFPWVFIEFHRKLSEIRWTFREKANGVPGFFSAEFSSNFAKFNENSEERQLKANGVPGFSFA